MMRHSSDYSSVVALAEEGVGRPVTHSAEQGAAPGPRYRQEMRTPLFREVCCRLPPLSDRTLDARAPKETLSEAVAGCDEQAHAPAVT